MRKQSLNNIKEIKRIPNLGSMSELRQFTNRWFVGIVKAIQAVTSIENDSELEQNKGAKLMSRTDLSITHDKHALSPPRGG